MRFRSCVSIALLALWACSSEDPAEDPHPEGTGGTSALTKAPTTLEQTLQPKNKRLSSSATKNPAIPENLASFSPDFGDLIPSKGETYIPRTLDGSTPPAPGPNAKRLVRYAHLADLQIPDDESPMRLAALDGSGTFSPALRPQDWYLCRMANAAVRTINFLHSQDKLDFTLLGGDNADSAQSNEIDWVLKIFNGGEVKCDSGEMDDPVPGPNNDGKDAFIAEGLKMPWKWVTGNHDILIQGNAEVNEQRKATAIGNSSSTGTRDWKQGGAVIKGDVIADPKRALLERKDLMTVIQGNGDGHGLGAAQVSSGKAFYHFDVEGTPLRFLVLDTGSETGGAEGMLHQADVDAYVKPALEEAKAQGKWVILASHHASETLSKEGGAFGKEQKDAVLTEDWRTLLGGYGNVIYSMVAHTHEHRVTPVQPSVGPGYWEIMTSAIADFPHEFRIVEIWDQDNGWLMLRATCVDLSTENDPVAEEGRRLGTIDMLSGWSPDGGPGTLEQRNVDLYVKKPGG